MTRTLPVLLFALVLSASGGLLLAQKPSETHPPGQNPHGVRALEVTITVPRAIELTGDASGRVQR